MDCISVIVPVYNVEKYLDRCLESIESQTYSELEIILIDDGSTDQCPLLCDKWTEKDARIKVIHKENGGLSDARNTGLKNATGNYISFIDSDDWIEPFFFEYLLRELKKNKCDAAGCRYRICSDYSEFQQDYKKTGLYDRSKAMSALIDDSIKQVVWNKLYKTELIRDLYFEKGKYHEDEFWSYQVFGRINRYCELDYTGYNYFQRTDSIMGVKYSKKRLDAVEAKCRRQKYLDKNMPELASKGRINLFFTCLYQGQMCLRNSDGKDKESIIAYLKNTLNTFEFKCEDLAELSLKHKIWYKISRVSFVWTCRLRNCLHIGI